MEKGVVTKVVGNIFSVKRSNGEILESRIKGKLRMLDIKSTNPATVGDIVLFTESDGVGAIQEIEDRKNYIIRKSTNLSKQSHIIAANVDQALLIVTLKEPETKTDFIDRYLASAEAFSIPVIIAFNKFDLYTHETLNEYKQLKQVYEGVGYKCIETSAKTGFNLVGLTNILRDKITVINGNSGVGKSSLITAIDSSLQLKIGKISDYHKTGMHTTSFSEMFGLSFGGSIIDTPGIKGFGLIDFEKEELYHFFPEIFKTAENCKFYNCMHIHEPGCAVVKAVEEGNIATTRYISYFNIFIDGNAKYRG